MDYAYLAVSLDETQGSFVSGKTYYYKLPIYDEAGNALTEQRAKDQFIIDQNRHLHLLDALPTDGCANYVKLGDLRIPVSNPHPATVSVLRIDHIVRSGKNFEIVAELKDWGNLDKAYVELIGLAGTTGRYVMTAVNQEVPVDSGTTYSWRKQFPALSAGATVDYRVYANDQQTFMSGTIRVDNADPVHGPVWGGWMPKIVQIGTDYSDQVPEDAATGTGPINYFLISAPAWYSYAQNTRNVVSIAPGTIPSVAETVTYRAADSNGQTDKTFTLQYGAALDMVAAWGFENVPGGSKLYFGMGPNDDLPYTVKLTQQAGSGFADSSAHTAERIGMGLNGVSYPWRAIYDNVPVGTYRAEIVRSNGQKRYAQFVFTGQQGSWTLPLSSNAPTTPTNPGNADNPASLDGDDIWTNIGVNDGSLNDNVAPIERILKSLAVDGPTQCAEGEQIQLRCLATYTDDSVVNITTQASSVLTGGGAGLNAAGILNALVNSVTGDTHTVNVTYTFGGKTATYQVQIIDRSAVPITLTKIEWQGPDSALKGKDTQYRVIGSYDNNTTADLTNSAAKGYGVTGALMLQDGTLRIAADTTLTQAFLDATYNGKQAAKTVDIKSPTISLAIQYVNVAVKEGKLLHYVKTNPTSRVQGAEPTAKIYYRLRTNLAGGSLPQAYAAWNALDRLFDHTDSGLGSLQNSSLLTQGFNHMLYGSYFGANYPQHTVYMQLSLSPTGANAIECQYTVPAFATQPLVNTLQIYPNNN